MAAHPVAFAGFFAHTGALDDPYARLQRTATVMDAVAFGTKARADKLTAHVRAMHRTRLRRARRGRRPVPGRDALPRRRPRAAAVDPGRAGRVGDARLQQVRPLALARRARTPCGATTASSAAASACASARCRATSTASSAYMADMYASGELFVTPAARALAIDIVLHPPVPLHRQAAGRAGQPDHGRLAARRHPPPVRLPLGPAARASRCAAAPSTSSAWRADSRVEPDWTASARTFASTTRTTPSMTSASQHRRRRRRRGRPVLITRNIAGDRCRRTRSRRR